jgi:hypothetical protein
MSDELCNYSTVFAKIWYRYRLDLGKGYRLSCPEKKRRGVLVKLRKPEWVRTVVVLFLLQQPKKRKRTPSSYTSVCI